MKKERLEEIQYSLNQIQQDIEELFDDDILSQSERKHLNEQKNKRIFNYWCVYDDTHNLYNTNNILLEM